MYIGIDASNIRPGNGVMNHLAGIMRVAEPSVYGFEKIVIWAPESTLACIEDRPWLVKRFEPILEQNYLQRAVWQRNCLGARAREEGCKLLFVPGGAFATDFCPLVTMNRNLLPFVWREIIRYGVSWHSLKLVMLRVTSRLFRKANGVIFLTHFAQNKVLGVTGTLSGSVAVIPHGVDTRFLKPPRASRTIEECSPEQPFCLVYVSRIEPYKHQWHVVEAVGALRRSGLPVMLYLIGPAGPSSALGRLERTLKQVDPSGAFVRYLGAVPHATIQETYMRSDLAIFASSCEAFGQILTEYMAAGLPIACSDRSAMPEILGGAGLYFDPEDPDSIASVLRRLIESPALRAEKALAAYMRAQQYSWKRCTEETFGFLKKVVDDFDKDVEKINT